MKRNLITMAVAAALVGAMFTANAYFAPGRTTQAQQEETKKAEEKVAEAKAEEEKAKELTVAANEAAPGADKAAPPASAPAPAPAPAAPATPVTEWPAVAPDVYKVKFETTKGDIIIECHKEWAPLGSDRFYQLCKEGFYDNSGFFRVVPGFVAQFGLAADPAVTAQWQSQEMPDDPVKQTNAPGYLCFAARGPNTRTTQVFINYGDNNRLDGMGFAPFGKIIEGMEVAKKISAEYGERPRQDLITSQGDEYITKFFPNMDKIKKTTLVK